MLKTFFTTFSFKKEDYQEQASQQDYSYEQKHQKFYEEQKHEEQKSYQEEKTENKSEYKEQNYTKRKEPKNGHGEFQQFYSESAYTVLGVSADDDYKKIKQVYRKLVREYHPDLNPENIELYTEITQHINSAWEKVESWKK